MNHGPLVFLGVFFAVALSWFAAVVGPHFQFGNQEMVVIEETGANYPLARAGEARQGAEVYRANGCSYCHTQQVRPRSEGADLARDWGTRRTVSRDYLRDEPVVLGQQRIGPDLANMGQRATNAPNPFPKLFQKLYDARIDMPGSMMPRYPFLFEQRRVRPGAGTSADALVLPEHSAPPAGYEVVPRPEAYALVRYLLSLKSDALFFEVFPTPPAKQVTNLVDSAAGATNGAAAGTGTNAVPAVGARTNAPSAQ